MADLLAFVVDEVVLGFTENAFRFDLLQNYLIVLDEDFQVVFGGDAEHAADFHGDDDAAKVIQFAYDPSRFHARPFPDAGLTPI
jgi:hypothetical protein